MPIVKILAGAMTLLGFFILWLASPSIPFMVNGVEVAPEAVAVKANFAWTFGKLLFSTGFIFGSLLLIWDGASELKESF